MKLECNFEICRTLSDLVYSKEPLPKILQGWENCFALKEFGEVIEPKKKKKKNAKAKSVSIHKRGNFVCTAYKKSNEVIISFRGSDDVLDFFADTKFINKKIPFSSKSAINIYSKIRKDNPECKIWLTGHSLGGGYAQIVAGHAVKNADKNVFAITFNSPGVGYILTKDEKEQYEEQISSNINNYVVMNDFVGNFREHLGCTYYYQPFPLDIINMDCPKEKRTPHGCIKEVPLVDLGRHFVCPKGWNSRLAWALYVFDVNKVTPKRQVVREVLDLLVNYKHIERAVGIIKKKQDDKKAEELFKLLNSFKFKAGVLNRNKYELVADIS